MEIRQLTDRLSVSPQIGPEDVAALRAAGFRAIICNRPDDEEAGQPRFEAIAAVARAHGLPARHIPITPGQMGAGHISALASALAELPAPVLAYCRSGARSAALFEAMEAEGRPAAE